MLLGAVALVARLGGAGAWWDGGHILTAEVARQSLSAAEVSQLDALLADWEEEYPTTSAAETASMAI